MEQRIIYKKPTTLLNYPLNKKQQAYFNYIFPLLATSIVYILHYAADSCLALQHYREDDFLYASLTFFITYVPAIGSLFFTLSNVEIWPEDQRFGRENVKWFVTKLGQHLLFPIWAVYRFAEQLFWSIEACRSNDENEIAELFVRAERNSNFELYHFLQAYTQAVIQILFQLHIIFRHNSNFNKNTVDMQVFSIVMSLIKMAVTTSSYQRFKSQKLIGKQYPWTKTKNSNQPTNITSQIPEETEKLKERHESETMDENSETEADRRNSGLSESSSQFDTQIHKKLTQPDFALPLTVISYQGLPEDDIAGKTVSFFWWFSFILPRMLTLSAFAYFFPAQAWWVCATHYVITFAFLLYDAQLTDVAYYRAVFILFTAYVYMFCLIEFKIKFKKVRFIYNGYFILVYLENFVMTSVWFYSVEFSSDWWYKYVFYVIVISSLISAVSMLFYIFLLKPKKIVFRQEFRNSKLL